MSSWTSYIASQPVVLQDFGMEEAPKHPLASLGLHCSNLSFDFGPGTIFWCSNIQFG